MNETGIPYERRSPLMPYPDDILDHLEEAGRHLAEYQMGERSGNENRTGYHLLQVDNWIMDQIRVRGLRAEDVFMDSIFQALYEHSKDPTSHGVGQAIDRALYQSGRPTAFHTTLGHGEGDLTVTYDPELIELAESRKMKSRGWFNEPDRHALSARGIKTRRK